MRIYGVDFTSAPSSRKRIVCAEAYLDGATLMVNGFASLSSWHAFEAALATPGPWVAGMDFPFGQPRRLIENLGWPLAWEGYIGEVARLTKAEFAALLNAYRVSRPVGDRHHLRATDRAAGAVSPMMLVGVPVAKMFYEGAPRLLRAGVSVLPSFPLQSDRVAVEAYPALFARRVCAESYKNDSPRKQTPQQAHSRKTIIHALCDKAVTHPYGVRVALAQGVAELAADDPTGDHLDALICALQAAWSWLQREQNWGFPVDTDKLEGWIADPTLCVHNAGTLIGDARVK
ncbi:MAG: DUF429 domain-containing protein [Aggregatilineales bacterium]